MGLDPRIQLSTEGCLKPKAGRANAVTGQMTMDSTSTWLLKARNAQPVIRTQAVCLDHVLVVTGILKELFNHLNVLVDTS